MENQDPSTLASDMEAMQPYFTKVSAIMGGLDAMIENASTFLPQMEDESNERYKFRKSVARFTNVFRDTVEGLANRPFSEPVTLDETTSTPELEAFAEDVNGSGTSLHSFAAEMFFNAIANSVDWFLVDHSDNVPQNATVAQEKALGARPYWVRYPADYVLAAYTEMIGGKEQFTHVRLYEPVTERVGFTEVVRERVRVLEREDLSETVEDGESLWGPPTVEVWEKIKAENGKEEWVIVQPRRVMDIESIPLVPCVTGWRKGKTWDIHPPMLDSADLQINLFQQETGLEFAKRMSAYPMFAGNGVAPDIDDQGNPKPIHVGPGRVLYAPPTGEGSAGQWRILEPSAQSLQLLRSDVQDTIKELRELGRQPLTANSGNLTRITTAVAAQKGNSAVLAWLMEAKEALELGLYYTGLWLNQNAEPKVLVNTEFDIALEEDDGFSSVMDMRKEREISRDTMIHEAKRRNILDRDYDPEADLDLLLAEIESAEEVDEDPDDLDDDEDDDTVDDDQV